MSTYCKYYICILNIVHDGTKRKKPKPIETALYIVRAHNLFIQSLTMLLKYFDTLHLIVKFVFQQFYLYFFIDSTNQPKQQTETRKEMHRVYARENLLVFPFIFAVSFCKCVSFINSDRVLQ